MLRGHDSDKFRVIARERKYRVRFEMKLFPVGHLMAVRPIFKRHRLIAKKKE